ncbi:MAG: LapA family protein [Magnetococcales bacterium]|nr:LapA family protein [Magnetococcales bacterium]
MSKPFVSLFLALLLLIFASQNMVPAQIRFIVGPPVELPLILIISGAFICGFVVATVSHLARRALRNRRKDGM